VGDVFKNIKDSTIFNRNIVMGSISNLRERQEDDKAELLEKLTQVVEESGNAEAGELLEGLSEELVRPEPRKSMIRRIWAGFNEILPSVPKMLEVAEGFEKLVN
jgi:hypothetical protein